MLLPDPRHAVRGRLFRPRSNKCARPPHVLMLPTQAVRMTWHPSASTADSLLIQLAIILFLALFLCFCPIFSNILLVIAHFLSYPTYRVYSNSVQCRGPNYQRGAGVLPEEVCAHVVITICEKSHSKATVQWRWRRTTAERYCSGAPPDGFSGRQHLRHPFG
jgi:hypothetical protein